MKTLSAALLVLLFSFAFSSARAAQLATVDVDNTDVLVGPMPTASVLTHLKKGLKVTVSNYPIEGFYKVRTQGGSVGWVKADKLVLRSAPAATAAAGAASAAGGPTPAGKVHASPGVAAALRASPSKLVPNPKTSSIPDFQLDTVPEIEVGD